MTSEQPIPNNDLPQEEWRPVLGYESLYSVSSLGRVRRDIGYRRPNGHILKTPPSKSGYLKVTLYRANKRTDFLLHYLVAVAFIGPRPLGLEVNHVSGKKSDNSHDLLEFCTPSENHNHAARTGLKPVGVKHFNAKLDSDHVREIRRLRRETALTIAAIGLLFGVSHQTVSRIVNMRARKHDG